MTAPALLVLALLAQTPDAFDHARHTRLVPACAACHVGAQNPDLEIWPSPVACAACHDGTIERRVSWSPPTEPHPSNLKFVHDLVPIMARQTPQGPVPLRCRDCHVTAQGVVRAEADRCIACHAPGSAHLAAPDTLCSTCHLPLVRAASLRREDIAGFPKPPSHRAPGFALGGHGALAERSGSVSCAICHARDFCATCHVDAPERAAIQALEPDPRSRAITAELRPPPSHRDPTFIQRHGAMVRATPQRCGTCHTQESCLACHAQSQRVSVALHPAGPGRAVGAQPTRAPPLSHRDNFVRRHNAVASAAPSSCAGCHVRTDCMNCHRSAAGAGPGYHPADFLTRHPAAAYARESRCADCHSTGGFCQACHAAAGLGAQGPLRSGYHDASRTFSAGHGDAARQSLESCTACHVERDCLSCHSAIGGRRFNPHGPGFDAARMRRKNPEMCTVCHGTAIPGGD